MYNILYLCSFPQNNRDMKLHNFHNMGYDSGVVHFPFLPFTCFANWHHVPALPLTCVVELTTHHVGVLVVPGAGTDSSPDTVLHHRHPPSLVLVPERAVLQTQLQGCKGKKSSSNFKVENAQQKIMKNCHKNVQLNFRSYFCWGFRCNRTRRHSRGSSLSDSSSARHIYNPK